MKAKLSCRLQADRPPVSLWVAPPETASSHPSARSRARKPAGRRRRRQGARSFPACAVGEDVSGGSSAIPEAHDLQVAKTYIRGMIEHGNQGLKLCPSRGQEQDPCILKLGGFSAEIVTDLAGFDPAAPRRPDLRPARPASGLFDVRAWFVRSSRPDPGLSAGTCPDRGMWR